jgi:acetyl-CoA acetyltransferase
MRFSIRSTQRFTHALRGAVSRQPNLDAAEVEDVILGCGFPEGCQGKRFGNVTMCVNGGQGSATLFEAG